MAPGRPAVRDADRIMAAVKDAGVTQIDHMIVTHWHLDHFGGLSELAARIPIKQYIDHGANAQPNPPVDDFLKTDYPALYAKATHMVAKAGDKIPVAGLDWRVLSSDGQVMQSSLPGAGKPNPDCANYKPTDHNAEDPKSLGFFIQFGKFRTVHLGDLTKDKEFELMCPANRIGTVDLLLGFHHGQTTSNSPVMVHALRPRVGIMNDGTRKGGEPETMQTIYSSPGLEDLWEMHFSQLSGQEYTVPGRFIANVLDDPLTAMPIAPITAPTPGPNVPPPPQHNSTAYWIKVSAQPDGTFTVTNTRQWFQQDVCLRRRPANSRRNHFANRLRRVRLPERSSIFRFPAPISRTSAR